MSASNQIFHILTLSLFAAVLGCGAADKKSNENPPNPEQKETNPEDPANPEQPGQTEVSNAPTPVLAFLGGYTSCPTDGDGNDDPRKMDFIDMFEATEKSLGEVAGIAKPAYLLSCYGIDPESISYILSTEPDKVHSRTVARMELDFVELVKSVNGPKVFLIGHSYGAYTALKMLGGLPEDLTVSGIVTLDAISKVGCTPSNALPAVLGIGPAPKECLEAPADITAEEQLTIAARTKSWLNYYQIDSPILHSGEFQPAKNFQMHYTSTGLTPHMDVLFDDDVEESVVGLIVKEAGSP